ncbi:MAG: U32 family peptidase [Clostridia bacterium]|nr:U32 family peptidase [Clostridia bacterium]
MSLPELLAPAGSFRALEAAIDAGADAVYLGGEAFGARAYAKNFTREEIAEAAKLSRAYGVKTYVTLNTLIYDREMRDVLEYAAFLENAGVDALIIADVGAASLIHKYIPTMRLHGSTQFSGHNAEAAKFLYENGFERMVAARELSKEDLTALVKNSPIEIETFIHGALCVSHSGQCLLSSMVGGRSGNRGMCAQPCRLPDKFGKYPLSLKDLSMASRIPELLSTGAASLKIEGRMKSPEYVHGVVKIYRRLLDERRNASNAESRELEEIFSRDGFTTGYFDRKINSSMLGTRSEDAKKSSRELTPFEKISRKVPIEIFAELKENTPFKITVRGEKGEVVTLGNIPEAAHSAPLTKEALEKNLTKLGNTPFTAAKCETDVDEGLILRVSEINALRREAVEKYSSLGEREHIAPSEFSYRPAKAKKENADSRTALCVRGKNLPKADEFFNFFDMVFLPLAEFLKCTDARVKGVALPAVIFESEIEKVKDNLSAAIKKGATHALVGNYGHLAFAKEAGLVPVADTRLNVTNSESAFRAFENGFDSVILSPELTAAQLRDIGGRVSHAVYGRLPVMLLEKCFAKEVSGCERCENDRAVFTDRVGARFPILREEPHRNVLFNSVPTYALDKAPFGAQHFIFSTESENEILSVIGAAKNRLAPKNDIRRIKEK